MKTVRRKNKITGERSSNYKYNYFGSFFSGLAEKKKKKKLKRLKKNKKQKKKKKKRFSRFVKDRAQEHRKEKSAKKPKQLIKYIEPTNFLYFYEKSVSQKYPQGNNTSNEDEPFFNYNTTEN